MTAKTIAQRMKIVLAVGLVLTAGYGYLRYWWDHGWIQYRPICYVDLHYAEIAGDIPPAFSQAAYTFWYDFYKHKGFQSPWVKLEDNIVSVSPWLYFERIKLNSSKATDAILARMYPGDPRGEPHDCKVSVLYFYETNENYGTEKIQPIYWKTLWADEILRAIMPYPLWRR